MKSSFQKNTLKDILILTSATISSSLLIWLPHLLSVNFFYNLNFIEGFNTIYRNYDGINYIVIAKSLYNPQIIASLPQQLPANYYAAHFPLYPLFILLLSPLIGFLKPMIIVPLLFTLFSVIAFYILIVDLKLSEKPLLLSLIFLVLPARWLVVHTVGSPEPIFIFFTILVFYFLIKYENTNKQIFIFISAVFGFLAQLTRPPGALIAISIGLYIIWKILQKKESYLKNLYLSFITYYPYILIPFALLIIFSWYSITYQDFFAYFHSGDNIHLVFPPYQVFNINQYWVGTIWLEDVIYVFLLGFSAAFLLWKKKLYSLSFFVLTYLIASIFVAHRDISRYTLPIFPFALIAFEKFLTSKEFKIVLIILLLGIYLYSQNFILNNTAPIPNIELFN